jgi:hypothetical protein
MHIHIDIRINANMHEYIHKHTELYDRAHIICVRREVGKVAPQLLELNIKH